MNILEARTADGRLIAEIGFDPSSDLYSFAYSAKWMASSDAYLISPAIGFDSQPASATVKRFIENLLPEGSGLDAVAQSSHLSKSNTFAPIRAVGQESTGAIMLMPPSQKTPRHGSPRLIGDEEILSRINSRDSIPFSVWDGKVRLSIAGLQDKIAVFLTSSPP